jgi:hypothetical protein
MLQDSEQLVAQDFIRLLLGHGVQQGLMKFWKALSLLIDTHRQVD